MQGGVTPFIRPADNSLRKQIDWDTETLSQARGEVSVQIQQEVRVLVKLVCFSCLSEVTAAVRPWDSAVRNSWELARDPTPSGMPGCCAPLPCCAAHSCSHQLPAKGLSDAQSEIRTAWNNLFLENVHLCG